MRLRSKNIVSNNAGSSNNDEAIEAAAKLTENTTSKSSLDEKSNCAPVGAPVQGVEGEFTAGQGAIRGTVTEMGIKSDSQLVDETKSTFDKLSQLNKHYVTAKSTFKSNSKYVIYSLQVTSTVLIFLYLVLPTTVSLFPSIISEIAFLHRVRWPPFVNLSEPSDVGLSYTRAFSLQTEENIQVGAWHTLPTELWSADIPYDDYQHLLGHGHPIILYLHGNAGTRGGWHRVQLYKVLAKAGFHVISVDYRGFGDSSGSPSEDGVCQDGLAMYHWIRQHSAQSPVYIWGHSMGSGVATKVASQLCDEGVPLSALFLEAPFNNIIEAATVHPFSQPFKFLPWFTWAFVEGMKFNKIYFSSDTSISRVTVPTLILHAKDDGIVPYDLGHKLYTTAVSTKKQGIVDMVTFEAHHGYGHKHIHKAPELTDIIRSFIEKISRG